MFIYVIRHKASGREYIGKTVRSLSQRWACHRSSAKHGEPSALYNAMRAEGVEAFEMELLATAASDVELDALEKRFIIERHTRTPHGYNICAGGQRGPIGHMPSAEARAAQSVKMKGRTPPNKGVSPSAETRAKLRAAGVATAYTEAQVAARSRPKAPETRAKIAATLTGRKYGAEQCRKWSAVAKANRAKVAATKARWAPEQREENRQKHAEARRRWWETRTPEQLEQIKQQRAATTRARWAALNEEQRLAYIKNMQRGQVVASH